jgi:hypothetical protein
MQMVRVTTPSRAAWKLTVAVSGLECAPDRRGYSAGAAPDIEHRSASTMLHDDDRGITEQALRRFRGNARRAVAHLDDGVTFVWHTSRFSRRR